jgi:hypothetical protein
MVNTQQVQRAYGVVLFSGGAGLVAHDHLGDRRRGAPLNPQGGEGAGRAHERAGRPVCRHPDGPRSGCDRDGVADPAAQGRARPGYLQGEIRPAAVAVWLGGYSSSDVNQFL